MDYGISNNRYNTRAAIFGVALTFKNFLSFKIFKIFDEILISSLIFYSFLEFLKWLNLCLKDFFLSEPSQLTRIDVQ